MTSPLVATTDRPYQLLPPLTVEQRDLLRQSIAENGVLEPVVFDDHGEILDGHHRVEIAEELGIEYPRRVIEGLDRPDKHMYALTVNVARRQLDQASRSGLVNQLRVRGMSIRDIAKVTGIPRETVRRSVSGDPSGSPERITGSDKKVYSAARSKPDLAPTILEALGPAGREGLDQKGIAAAWDEAPAEKELLRALEKLTKSGELLVTRWWGTKKPRKWASAEAFGDLTADVLSKVSTYGARGATAWQLAFLIEQPAADALEDTVLEILRDQLTAGQVSIVGENDSATLWALTSLLTAESLEEEPVELPTQAVEPARIAPEVRQQIEDDAERIRMVGNAHRKADRLIHEVSGLITEIEAGVLLGEPGLVTAEMVAELRNQADRLERYVEEKK